ncbi:hypothetical protein PR048_032043 [Dryococelus australis]|uniref:Uncharacterized protein n=1 Tax=Dryococelus australis TaxID=614101 RepID=A0ABQ9G6Z9_9NEOP|nr:hypothetical protein PR048_032043 [Dryococelus australis]
MVAQPAVSVDPTLVGPSIQSTLRLLSRCVTAILWLPECSEHGGVVVTLLASHSGEPCSVPCGFAPGFSHVRIVPDNATGRRVFSEIFRLPRPFISTLLHTHLASPSSALKTSFRTDIGLVAVYGRTGNDTFLPCSHRQGKLAERPPRALIAVEPNMRQHSTNSTLAQSPTSPPLGCYTPLRYAVPFLHTRSRWQGSRSTPSIANVTMRYCQLRALQYCRLPNTLVNVFYYDVICKWQRPSTGVDELRLDHVALKHRVCGVHAHSVEEEAITHPPRNNSSESWVPEGTAATRVKPRVCCKKANAATATHNDRYRSRLYVKVVSNCLSPWRKKPLPILRGTTAPSHWYPRELPQPDGVQLPQSVEEEAITHPPRNNSSESWVPEGTAATRVMPRVCCKKANAATATHNDCYRSSGVQLPQSMEEEAITHPPRNNSSESWVPKGTAATRVMPRVCCKKANAATATQNIFLIEDGIFATGSWDDVLILHLPATHLPRQEVGAISYGILLGEHASARVLQRP